ncbi:MAG: DnaJ domain-containing protein [Myxococcales bacterium]|nr:DnaJ domain-containing protein [Polyangiaceae bacterium]MDW8249081.1 DnaJ domain-containing protein [Myxococcales bacterium]
MSTLVAVATGTLERTPLTHLLVYCLDHTLSGTLVLQDPENLRHAVLFQRGVPVKVKTGTSVALLGKLLVEQGLISLPNVEDALVASQTLGMPLGKTLVEEGKLPYMKLVETLKLQWQRKLVYLFSLPGGTAYGFYEKDLLEAWGGTEPVPVDILAVLHAGISLGGDQARMNATLATLGERPLKLCMGVDFRRFGLSDRGRAVLDLLRVKPMSLTQLEEAGVASPTVVRQVIYTFLLTRHLDLGGNQKPPLGIEAPANLTSTTEAERAAVGRLKLPNIQKGGGIVEVNPPRQQTAPLPSVLAELFPERQEQPVSKPLSPELEARRQEVLTRAATIETENFFTMLGVPEDAPPAAVHAAFLNLAKIWHPDRLPPQLADLREQSSRIFAHIHEAFQTLSNPSKRAEYVKLLEQGGGSPEEQAKVTRALEAQNEYRKAEILLKKGDLAGAERFAQSAVEKDSEQPDYLSILAWIRACKPTASPDDIAASIRLLDTALHGFPNHQRSLWYRGSLLKRLGKDGLAILDFRKLLELDPRHIDAAREVRLYEMRSGSRSETNGGAKRSETGDVKRNATGGAKGLLGGLFKKP